MKKLTKKKDTRWSVLLLCGRAMLAPTVAVAGIGSIVVDALICFCVLN